MAGGDNSYRKRDMGVIHACAQLRALPIILALLLATAACTTTEPAQNTLDPQRQELAFMAAKSLRAQGKRVWCVPFARNLSGIDIRGNARTWWAQAGDRFRQGHEPEVGAVMAFAPSGSMSLGHVAVVSSIVDDRQIRIDHANWRPNEISLNMAVVDVSEDNDWSAVRVESFKGSLGRVYPIDGFIYPNYSTEQ